jgi:hypothetical protein
MAERSYYSKEFDGGAAATPNESEQKNEKADFCAKIPSSTIFDGIQQNEDLSTTLHPVTSIQSGLSNGDEKEDIAGGAAAEKVIYGKPSTSGIGAAVGIGSNSPCNASSAIDSHSSHAAESRSLDVSLTATNGSGSGDETLLGSSRLLENMGAVAAQQLQQQQRLASQQAATAQKQQQQGGRMNGGHYGSASEQQQAMQAAFQVSWEKINCAGVVFLFLAFKRCQRTKWKTFSKRILR